MTAGTANNPWKAWIILTAALLLLQAAIPLAYALNEKLCDELFKSGIVGFQQSYLYDQIPYQKLLYYIYFNGFMHVVPSVLFIFALVRSLPPYMMIVFSLLNALALSFIEFLISYS